MKKAYIGVLKWHDRFRAAWRVLTARELYFVSDNRFDDFPQNVPLMHFTDPVSNTVVVFADNIISYKGERP